MPDGRVEDLGAGCVGVVWDLGMECEMQMNQLKIIALSFQSLLIKFSSQSG